ncbi:helix-turn-helix transcriptional regulator [Solibacillus sp. FSL W8-0474]|uniref:helix-turn-helix transcriptional regulator n=1 Tax=Solibacillus sp. FSL W8-0474 TaxID=2975336 RepID=UPI0030F79B0A
MLNEEVGKMIKDRRIEKCMKQKDLAEKLDISRSYLSDIENNRYLPSFKLFLKINRELQLFNLNMIDGNTIQNNEVLKS